jgi:predicted DsbA family dithiol-disulfide isomerase
LALAAVGAGAWWGWPRIAQHFVGDFDFAPIADLPGFRRMASGRTSAAAPNPFIGLEIPQSTPATEPSPPALRANLCGALFGAPPPAGVVPIASFSDYNCPFCRILTDTLTDLEASADGGIRLTWHEWPLLGATSVPAARAALAAGKQGAYIPVHKRLMRTRFAATPEYLSLLAADLDLDLARLLADMDSPDVTAHLARSSALADVFGMPGTPALVVGRTLVVGAISAPVLNALVARERADGPLPACAL